MAKKQTAPIIKKQFGPPLGFRTPSAFRGRVFGGGKPQAKFDPSRFKTQHKG